jgi:hypothetical protein
MVLLQQTKPADRQPMLSLHSIHAHLPDPHLLTAAVYAVLQDVVRVDLAHGKQQREVFLSGAYVPLLGQLTLRLELMRCIHVVILDLWADGRCKLQMYPSLLTVLMDVSLRQPLLSHAGPPLGALSATLLMDVVLSSYRTYPSTTDVTKIATSGTDETADSEPKQEQEFRPKIAGAFVMCPLVNGTHCLIDIYTFPAILTCLSSY